MAKTVDFNAKKELKKLQKIVAQLPEDKRKITEGLVADASFMAEQLQSLRKYIIEHGWSEEYQNGANQFGKKTSVEADSYIKVQRQYSSIIKQLTDLLPSGNTAAPGAALMEFVKGGQ